MYVYLWGMDLKRSYNGVLFRVCASVSPASSEASPSASFYTTSSTAALLFFFLVFFPYPVSVSISRLHHRHRHHALHHSLYALHPHLPITSFSSSSLVFLHSLHSFAHPHPYSENAKQTRNKKNKSKHTQISYFFLFFSFSLYVDLPSIVSSICAKTKSL